MKRLTEQQFQTALARVRVGEQTAEIARGVLVEGRPQAEFVAKFALTKGAVSQAVNRVWAAHEPTGLVKVTAVLPAHQAYQVKRWAKQAKGKA